MLSITRLLYGSTLRYLFMFHKFLNLIQTEISESIFEKEV